MPEQARSECPSCGIVMEHEFCARCGEKRLEPADVSVHEYLAQVFGTLFSLEGKLWSSLARLPRPGVLTAEFLRGARVRRLKPFQLFALLNVVYFFVQPWTGTNIFNAPLSETVFFGSRSELHDTLVAEKRAELGLAADADLAVFKARFDARSNDWAKALIVVFVPALAGFSVLARRRRRFAEQLAFVTEFLSFKIVVLSIAAPCLWLAARRMFDALPSFSTSPTFGVVWSLATLCASLAWFVVASQRVFGGAAGAAALHALVLGVGYVVTWAFYHVLLFGVTLWSL
ncbi:MAG: DUF3667 domain-containing protein [Planctomycetes bacterium]|nr:DUF3667 domain-containing protein [Planctomycetota bacterium]